MVEQLTLNKMIHGAKVKIATLFALFWLAPIRPGWIRLFGVLLLTVAAVAVWEFRYDYRHEQGMLARINRFSGTVQFWVPGAPGRWFPD
jgi:hypothetical protein